VRLRNWVLLIVAAVTLIGCDKAEKQKSQQSQDQAPKGAVEILFTYGSEKEAWVNEVTGDFNRQHSKLKDGRPIYVRTVAQGSGECIDRLLDDSQQAHLSSPASEAFVRLGNAESQTRFGRDLLGKPQNLVLSPVVIAMWEPMAKALGWPGTPIGWSDILKLAQDPQGWAKYGFPQWGQFKFGHTHPDFSNSGLISLFAATYAAVGRTAGLQVNDIRSPTTASFLRGIENSVVHYGSSTGFFARKMFANGPSYLSAAVLYESLVVESYKEPGALPFPVVAIYPKEGTFWSDHPVAIVNREWVKPEHREAAETYIQFLLAPAQQEKALKFGFRPALVEIPISAPIDPAHGVDPQQPKTVLEVPTTPVIAAIRELWKANKKHSRITLAFDVSGSMNENNRIKDARDGAKALLDYLTDDDAFALVPFNDRVLIDAQPEALQTVRQKMQRGIESLIAGGGTALCDAIAAAYRQALQQNLRDPARISAIVVLTDGQDTNSRINLEQLLNEIRYDSENKTVRVFTIGYDAAETGAVLKQIAEATQARYYEGRRENIRDVFRDISTFF
jgi:Ca-activated chloride channel family protein